MLVDELLQIEYTWYITVQKSSKEKEVEVEGGKRGIIPISGTGPSFLLPATMSPS